MDTNTQELIFDELTQPLPAPIIPDGPDEDEKKTPRKSLSKIKKERKPKGEKKPKGPKKEKKAKKTKVEKEDIEHIEESQAPEEEGGVQGEYESPPPPLERTLSLPLPTSDTLMVAG